MQKSLGLLDISNGFKRIRSVGFESHLYSRHQEIYIYDVTQIKNKHC
jgi:hypothetical protein